MPTIITSTGTPATGGKKADFLNTNVAYLIAANPVGSVGYVAGIVAAQADDNVVADRFIDDIQAPLAVLMGPASTPGSAAALIAADKVLTPPGALANKSVNEVILDTDMATVRLQGGATIKFSVVFDQLFSKMYKPTSVRDFVEHLSEANRLAIAEGIAEGTGSLKDKSVSSVITELEKIGAFKEFLKGFRPASSLPFVPALSINDNKNLSLLLANPAIARIVMEERKKQSLLAFARPVAAMGFGPFGGIPPSISMSFRGGANAALASIDYSNYAPIEMRGAGPMLAAMRGGHGGMVIGTTSSPTQWRPIDDNSFISASLEAAIAQLKANIAAQNSGASLDNAVDDKVKSLIKDLKDAEKAVRAERDRLTTMNNAIATGYKPTGAVSTTEITAATESYNAAMKNRQKLENKLFRVVIALGGKQVYP